MPPAPIPAFSQRLRLPATLLLAGAVLAVPFGRKGEDAAQWIAIGAVLLALAMAWASRRDPATRSAFWRWIPGAVLALFAAIAVALLNPLPLEDSGDLLFSWLHLAGATLGWLLLRAERRRPPLDLLDQGLVWLLVYAGISWVACWTSLWPSLSFEDFAESGAGLQIALAFLAFAYCRWTGQPRRLFQGVAIFGAVVCLVACGATAAALVLGDQTTEGLQNAAFLRDLGDGTLIPFRVQWPFEHHNRLASYALLVLFSSLVAAQGAPPRRHVLWLAITALATACLVLTKTRGAYLAAGLGLAAYGLALARHRIAWRLAVPVAVALLALALALNPVRARAWGALTGQAPDGSASTVLLRSYAYRSAWAMGWEHPWTGIGYGWQTFELEYRREHRLRFSDPEVKTHAHNNLLQVFATSGLLAAGTLAGFGVWLLLVAVRRLESTPTAPPLLGFFVAVTVFGMTNFSLRYGLGALIGMALVAGVGLLERPGDDGEDSEGNGSNDFRNDHDL